MDEIRENIGLRIATLRSREERARIAFKLARSKQLARYYESRWIEARSGADELERVKLMLEEEIA